MRKTLVALAVVTSVLLLQTPAWAPKLYLEQIPQSDTDSNRKVKVISDTCTNKTLTVKFNWGPTISGTTTLTNGVYQYQRDVTVPANHPQPITIDDVKSATCAGERLAFTGSASTSLLVLGLSLLVIGALLVLTGRRRPLLRRG
jgi:hypothetical protein